MILKYLISFRQSKQLGFGVGVLSVPAYPLRCRGGLNGGEVKKGLGFCAQSRSGYKKPQAPKPCGLASQRLARPLSRLRRLSGLAHGLSLRLSPTAAAVASLRLAQGSSRLSPLASGNGGHAPTLQPLLKNLLKKKETV